MDTTDFFKLTSSDSLSSRLNVHSCDAGELAKPKLYMVPDSWLQILAAGVPGMIGVLPAFSPCSDHEDSRKCKTDEAMNWAF